MNHKTGDKCNLKFVPYSYFSRDVARKVSEVGIKVFFSEGMSCRRSVPLELAETDVCVCAKDRSGKGEPRQETAS